VVPQPPWRVVIVTRIPPVAVGFHAAVGEAGHEPVALLTIRDTDSRYGPEFTTPDLLGVWPQELDVLMPGLEGETVRVLASSLTEVEGARRVQCGDGPLWFVRTEPVSPDGATRASAPAPSRR
jgi:hypothetical protein